MPEYIHTESYEVIITGGGPAGLSCAQKLGEAGKKVLLLEQNSEIGPKVCAGGLLKDGLGDSKLPEKLFEYKFKNIPIYNFSKKQILSSNDYIIYTIDRKKLGQWQLKKNRK
jgi:flavin-dependent dehydrogenase